MSPTHSTEYVTHFIVQQTKHNNTTYTVYIDEASASLEYELKEHSTVYNINMDESTRGIHSCIVAKIGIHYIISPISMIWQYSGSIVEV